MKRMLPLAAAIAIVSCSAPAAARVHGQMFCWVPDVEIPIACDEDEEDDDESALLIAKLLYGGALLEPASARSLR
jgi:hypothetical protein